jgi:hypothetical protein
MFIPCILDVVEMTNNMQVDQFIRRQEDYVHVHMISTAVSHTIDHHNSAMTELGC